MCPYPLKNDRFQIRVEGQFLQVNIVQLGKKYSVVIFHEPVGLGGQMRGLFSSFSVFYNR